MSGQWKPGDVAMVTAYNRRTEYRAYFDGKTWREHEHDMFCVDRPASHRPLVVIDPEDREQVERLGELLSYHGDRELFADRMQVALREFANPAPPKPEEPTGLGAVVVDSNAVTFVRAGLKSPNTAALDDCWRPIDGPVVGDWKRWAQIEAVEVLSEGVTL